MKKIVLGILLLFLLSVFYLSRSRNTDTTIIIPDVKALQPCPEGVSFFHADYQIVNEVLDCPYGPCSETGGKTYVVKVGYFAPYQDEFGRVLFSYGDGATTITGLNTPWAYGAGYTSFPHAFSQPGDFPAYAVIESCPSYDSYGNCVNGTWKWICYASALPVYCRYNGWNSTVQDSGGSTTTFNANDPEINMNSAQPGCIDNNDNIIGGIEGTFSTTGRGGLYDGSSYSLPNDRPILSISNNSGKWKDIYIGGDTDISNSNIDYPPPYPDDFWWTASETFQRGGGYDDYPPPIMPPSLSLRTNLLTFSITRPDHSYKNYPNTITASNTYSAGTISNSSILWRHRVIGQPPTPTPPGDCDPGITCVPPTGGPPPNSWVFPAQVINSADKTKSTSARGIANVTLELYGSNDPWVNPTTFPWPTPGNGPAVNEFVDKLDDCVSVAIGGVFNEPGYCLLSTVQYYGWYLIKIINDQYEAESTSCTFDHTTRPPTALDMCAEMDNSDIRRGSFSDVSMGTYGGDVFYVDLAPTVTPSPTPTTAIVPWFQVQGGNAYANKDIFSSVPAGNAFNTNVTNTASEGTSYFGESFTPGFSEPVRNANSGSFPVAELVDYQSLYSRFGVSALTPIDGSDIDKSGYSGTGSTGNTAVYYRNGDLTLSTNWTGFTGNVVIFVHGDLAINTNVTVAQGSFLGFVVSGDITIDPDVTNVEGFYFTDHTITTGSSATQLTLSGTFVARDGFTLGRDLADDTLPAEVFEYRPDFSFTAPNELRRPYRNWQETAP